MPIVDRKPAEGNNRSPAASIRFLPCKPIVPHLSDWPINMAIVLIENLFLFSKPTKVIWSVIRSLLSLKRVNYYCFRKRSRNINWDSYLQLIRKSRGATRICSVLSQISKRPSLGWKCSHHEKANPSDMCGISPKETTISYYDKFLWISITSLRQLFAKMRLCAGCRRSHRRIFFLAVSKACMKTICQK